MKRPRSQEFEDFDTYGNPYGYYQIIRKKKPTDPGPEPPDKQIVFVSGINLEELRGNPGYEGQERNRNTQKDLFKCFETLGLDGSKNTGIVIISGGHEDGVIVEDISPHVAEEEKFFKQAVTICCIKEMPGIRTLAGVNSKAVSDSYAEFAEFKGGLGVSLAIFDFSSPAFEIRDNVIKTTYNVLAPGGSIFVEHKRPYQSKYGGINEDILNKLITEHSDRFEVNQIEEWPFPHYARDMQIQQGVIKPYVFPSHVDGPASSEKLNGPLAEFGIDLPVDSYYIGENFKLWVNKAKSIKIQEAGLTLTRKTRKHNNQIFYQTNYSLVDGAAGGHGGGGGGKAAAAFLDLC